MLSICETAKPIELSTIPIAMKFCGKLPVILRWFWAEQIPDSSIFSETTETIKLKFTIYPNSRKRRPRQVGSPRQSC